MTLTLESSRSTAESSQFREKRKARRRAKNKDNAEAQRTQRLAEEEKRKAYHRGRRGAAEGTENWEKRCWQRGQGQHGE